MEFVERALQFRCHEAALYGILSLPEQTARRGVLIVVGGPQYRAGSHRQFVLLARRLAAAGIPVLRFDYRGMGDSEGEVRDFEHVGDDIRAALDQFVVAAPGITEFAIFGLCDASCAALFYAPCDPRIRGLVLVNPWVRTDQGLAQAYLRHYYLRRLRDRELWEKILRGRFDYRAAAYAFVGVLAGATSRWSRRAGADQREDGVGSHTLPLPVRMLAALRQFRGATLFILSGNDLTAREFLDLADGADDWKALLASPNMTRRLLPDANHTFSRCEWRDQLAQWTEEWLRSF